MWLTIPGYSLSCRAVREGKIGSKWSHPVKKDNGIYLLPLTPLYTYIAQDPV